MRKAKRPLQLRSGPINRVKPDYWTPVPKVLIAKTLACVFLEVGDGSRSTPTLFSRMRYPSSSVRSEAAQKAVGSSRGSCSRESLDSIVCSSGTDGKYQSSATFVENANVASAASAIQRSFSLAFSNISRISSPFISVRSEF